MPFTKTWSETSPADNDNASEGASKIRDLKYALRERLAVEHIFEASETGAIGTHKWPLVTKTADYTATVNDEVILVDTTSAAVIITLPAASGKSGKLYHLIHIAGSNAATVDANASENVLGATTFVFTNRSIYIYCDGTAWYGLISGTPAAASGIATLNSSSKVVQDPANATATPTASKIPIANGSGKLDSWITAPVFDATVSVVTGSRAMNTQYQNGATGARMVHVCVSYQAAEAQYCYPIIVNAYIGASSASTSVAVNGPGLSLLSTDHYSGVTFLVPKSYYYKVTTSVGSLYLWTEWTMTTS